MSTLSVQPAALPKTGLRGLLKTFGNADAYGNPPTPHTGSIVITSDDRVGHIFLRGGRVYAIHYTGFTPPLARRLLTSEYIDRADYANLVATGTADDEATILAVTSATADQLENINRQMLLSSLTHLYTWTPAAWHWEPDIATDQNTISPLEPNLLVTATDERQGQWNALQRNYPEATNPDAVPGRGPDFPDGEDREAHPETRAILSLVDGRNSNRTIAGTVGLTRFELAGRLAAAIADESVTYAPSHDVGVDQRLTDLHDHVEALAQEREDLVDRLADIDRQIVAVRRDINDLT